MSSDFSFSVTAEASSQFFGRLIVSNIRPKGSNPPVKVDKYLYIKFKAPARIGNSDVNGVTHPWVDITPDISNQQIGTSNRYNVSAQLNFHNPYTFNGSETFTFYVNGNLNSDPNQFTHSFKLATDQVPVAANHDELI
jgi:hypothetical protein